LECGSSAAAFELTADGARPAANNLGLTFGCGRRPRQVLRAKFRGNAFYHY
jgi:hypothetical protein